MGWKLNDSTTSHTIYIFPFLSKMIALHQNVAKLSEYTDSAHTEVEDLSSRYMNGLNVHDRCGQDTRQRHPSCTACRRTANLNIDDVRVTVKHVRSSFRVLIFVETSIIRCLYSVRGNIAFGNFYFSFILLLFFAFFKVSIEFSSTFLGHHEIHFWNLVFHRRFAYM